jgi:hypothetical protein
MQQILTVMAAGIFRKDGGRLPEAYVNFLPNPAQGVVVYGFLHHGNFL